MSITIDTSMALSNIARQNKQASAAHAANASRLNSVKQNMQGVKTQIHGVLSSLNAPQQILSVIQNISDYRTAQRAYSIIKQFQKNNPHINYSSLRPAIKHLLDLLDIYSSVSNSEPVAIDLTATRARLDIAGQKAQQMLQRASNGMSANLRVIVQDEDSVNVYVDNIQQLMFSIWNIRATPQIQNIMQDAQQQFKGDESVPMQSVYNYIKLISNLKNTKKQRIVTLYTGRPSSHRQQLIGMNGLPNGIYLTSSLSFAQSFGDDYGQKRDVWKVRISTNYLMQTLDSHGHKQYRIITNGTAAPCEKQILSMGVVMASNWYKKFKSGQK